MPPRYQYKLPDLTGLDVEERMRLAIQAVNESTMDAYGQHALSLRRAAIDFMVVRNTLQARYNGTLSRQEAHRHQQKLTEAEERVLANWAKVQGRRGVPLSADSLMDHAAAICGDDIGKSWPQRFMERNPDLKVRWTQSLEKCRAQNVNYATVNNFFDIYEEVVKTYDIPQENIYNMDEKGIQLGVGKRIVAIIDRDQKSVYNIEDGNREMVTIVETLCADGSTLPPSIIFEGAHTNPEWSRNNPSEASVLSSPNAWTDKELGFLWLKKDFNRFSKERNKSGGYRLLILDGHNSHCTYKFCQFAEANKIIVICLPSHTTHVLQPCDVGGFGPLTSCWKSEVNRCTREGIKIDKYNLVEHYSYARSKAFHSSTIQSAFAKAGIWPINRDALDPIVFEPSLNTTTKPAQPLPSTIPELVPVIISTSQSNPSTTPNSSVHTSTSTPHISTTDTANTSQMTTHDLPPTRIRFKLAIPARLPVSATRDQYQAQNCQLFELVELAGQQIEADWAQIQLMDQENGRLRQRAFGKQKKKGKDKRATPHARHLTSEESLEALAMIDWKAGMQEVLKEVRERGHAIAEKAKKAAELEKREQTLEKQRVMEVKKMALEAEKAIARWFREMGSVAKWLVEDQAKEARREKREAERVEKASRLKAKSARSQLVKEAETPRKRGNTQKAKVVPKRTRRKKAAPGAVSSSSSSSTQSSHDEVTSIHFPELIPTPAKPSRPKPRPIRTNAQQTPAHNHTITPIPRPSTPVSVNTQQLIRHTSPPSTPTPIRVSGVGTTHITPTHHQPVQGVVRFVIESVYFSPGPAALTQTPVASSSSHTHIIPDVFSSNTIAEAEAAPTGRRSSQIAATASKNTPKTPHKGNKQH